MSWLVRLTHSFRFDDGIPCLRLFCLLIVRTNRRRCLSFNSTTEMYLRRNFWPITNLINPHTSGLLRRTRGSTSCSCRTKNSNRTGSPRTRSPKQRLGRRKLRLHSDPERAYSRRPLSTSTANRQRFFRSSCQSHRHQDEARSSYQNYQE